MKFGMGITLFYPEEEAFSYIRKVREIFGSVYVFDNSNSNIHYENKINTLSDKYNFTGENRGLSKAFNWFLKSAKEDSVDYLFLLDQDSSFDISKLTQLIKQIETEELDTNVAIRACKTVPWNQERIILENNEVSEVEAVISSGSFISVHVAEKYGLKYNEKLFVDHVDFDFCKQIREKGLKILCYNRYVLPQQLGYQYKGRICHSPVRHYYMVRDYGYFISNYYDRNKTLKKTFIYFLRRCFISLKEDRPIEKLKSNFYGYWDYIKRVDGEYKERFEKKK